MQRTPTNRAQTTKNKPGSDADMTLSGYKLKIEVKGFDYLNRELSMENQFDSIELAVAYLKLINVPCMFDLGT